MAGVFGLGASTLAFFSAYRREHPRPPRKVKTPAPDAAPPAAPPYTHAEYTTSVVLAKSQFGLVVLNTLGVEMEQGLIPGPYRVQHGDRVAVWGRWIVDTGHPDFHTEIHPPLLLATARATSSEETTTTVIGRPYLVSQRWPGGPGNLESLGMIDHLLEEADKIPLHSLRAEAQRHSLAFTR